MVVGSKTAEACDALHRNFKSFLALPKSLLNVTAFLAVVKDSLKVDASEAETFSDPHLEASSSDQDADDRRTSYRQATNNERVRPDAFCHQLQTHLCRQECSSCLPSWIFVQVPLA